MNAHLFRIALCITLCLPGGPPLQASASDPLRLWEIVELSLQARRADPNPYAAIPANTKEVLLEVRFTGTGGEAKGKQFTVAGFWDGGRTWKVRFAPPLSGTWEYRSFSADPGLSNKKGKFRVVEWEEEALAENPTRRGLVQVAGSGRHFQYADGTPFLWIGDTWWNWTKREIKFESYKTLVDDRAEKGFNVGQLFVAGNGWERSASLLDTSFTVLDLDLMRKVDSMIVYANSKGITVWVHPWWSRKDMDKTIGEEKIKRWWRYLVRRLGAYNVIWVLAGEYNMYNYGNLGLPFWDSLGHMVKSEDPYRRIVSVHNTPPFWDGGAEAPQWSTAEALHQAPWMDYNQIQVGHGRMANEMIPEVVATSYAMKPAKPVVVTEPWYEFVEGNPTGRDIRFGAWSAILSGAAGHSYGGGHVWLAHLPESPAGGGPWPLDSGFEDNTLNYQGAGSMEYLAGFFRQIPWWEMLPRPELVYEYPRDRYCLANPGSEYVLYLRWGGVIKLDMRDAAGTFNYAWFNPSTGETLETKTTEGGAIRAFASPALYPGTREVQDWVLHVWK